MHARFHRGGHKHTHTLQSHTSLPHAHTQGKKEFFRLSQGRMEFGTVDRVEMVLYEEADVIHQYISESPDRVILATWGECWRVDCGLWWLCVFVCPV